MVLIDARDRIASDAQVCRSSCGDKPANTGLDRRSIEHLPELMVIPRAYRPTIKATEQTDGSVIVRAGRSWVQFDAADLQQLYVYAADRPTIQRYVVAPESPHTDK